MNQKTHHPPQSPGYPVDWSLPPPWYPETVSDGSTRLPNASNGRPREAVHAGGVAFFRNARREVRRLQFCGVCIPESQGTNGKYVWSSVEPQTRLADRLFARNAFSKLSTKLASVIPSASHHSRSWIRSIRCSPISIFETVDCVNESLAASSFCVIPVAFLASLRERRKTSYGRVCIVFGTTDSDG
jgi:hypothetical protein